MFLWCFVAALRRSRWLFLDIFMLFVNHCPYSYCVRVSPAMANRMVDSAADQCSITISPWYLYLHWYSQRNRGWRVYTESTSFSPFLSLILLCYEGLLVMGWHYWYLKVYLGHALCGKFHPSHTHSVTESRRKRRWRKKSVKQAPVLPEDIGKQTAMHLIEEVTNYYWS